jgi:NAD(P)-dependent dehydrogenase (short-subunit alcohol dehydrogenase family)
MNSVKGKWALITGASRGVGRQIALYLAKEGANLVLHSRDLSHTDKILEEVTALGVEAYAVAADLSDDQAVRKLADDVLAKTAIDILFNDAGIQVPLQDDIYTMDTEEFLQSFKVNALAPMILTGKFAPGMVERGFGRIINTTSGINNQPEQSAYAASKGALDKATHNFVSTFEGSDVTINIADPGWVKSDLGGPNAHHDVESVVPGMVVAAFLDDKQSGRLFGAQAFAGLTLEEAVAKAETYDKSLYSKK